MSLLTLIEQAEPDTPVAGRVRLYVKSDRLLYKKGSDGVEEPIGSSYSPSLVSFSANRTAAGTIASAVYTKIIFSTVEYNIGNGYDSTLGRFTAPVAGYYLINMAIFFGAPSTGERIVRLTKNGSNSKYGADTINGSATITHGSWIVYMNGTTDYIEVHAYQNSGSSISIAETNGTWLQGHLLIEG
jgi:hypothetical protein